MAIEIIQRGTEKYKATCAECAAVFSYEKVDVWRNYLKGKDVVSCPCCGSQVTHLGKNKWSSQ